MRCLRTPYYPVSKFIVLGLLFFYPVKSRIRIYRASYSLKFYSYSTAINLTDLYWEVERYLSNVEEKTIDKFNVEDAPGSTTNPCSTNAVFLLPFSSVSKR